MRKILTSITLFFVFFSSAFAQTNQTQEQQNPATATQFENFETPDFKWRENVIIPKEIDWTERYILTELRDIRVDLEAQKRWFNKEIQDRQLSAVDAVVGYNNNIVNFFFIFMTVIVAGVWIVGWRTLADVKNTTKKGIEKETSKIIADFEAKIEDLEKEQKINIMWRQFNGLEDDNEKLKVLDRIMYYKPDSVYAKLEKSNIYLNFELYEDVINMVEEIIQTDISKHKNQAYFNRACAYNQLGNTTEAIKDVKHLLQVAPTYLEYIEESELLKSLLFETELQEFLK